MANTLFLKKQVKQAMQDMRDMQKAQAARPRTGVPGISEMALFERAKAKEQADIKNKDRANADLESKVAANKKDSPGTKPILAMPMPATKPVYKPDIPAMLANMPKMPSPGMPSPDLVKSTIDSYSKANPGMPSPGMGTPTNASTRPAPMEPMPFKPGTAPMPEKPYPVTGNNGNLASKLPTGMMTPQPVVQPGRPAPAPGMKRGGSVRNKPEAKFSSGGSASKASSRGDGIAQRGKTKGRMR